MQLNILARHYKDWNPLRDSLKDLYPASTIIGGERSVWIDKKRYELDTNLNVVEILSEDYNLAKTLDFGEHVVRTIAIPALEKKR